MFNFHVSGMNGAIAKAQQIAARTPGAMILQQFENSDNPKAHRWVMLLLLLGIVVKCTTTTTTTLFYCFCYYSIYIYFITITTNIPTIYTQSFILYCTLSYCMTAIERRQDRRSGTRHPVRSTSFWAASALAEPSLALPRYTISNNTTTTCITTTATTTTTIPPQL